MRKTVFSLLLLIGLCAGNLTAQDVSSWTDAELWNDFSTWADELEPLPPGRQELSTDRYVARLKSRGASEEEAAALLERIQTYRRGHPERERVYWNARFKLGGGPNQPLRLLAETVRRLKPGAALDVATGRGRNGIYLASLGWKVTAYDLSPDALAAAQAYAEAAGVSLKTIQASHDSFPFGEDQWDLIVCSYAYMFPHEQEWPERLRKALKPGGTLVLQTSWSRQASLPELLEHWKNFRFVRYEDVNAGEIDEEWPPSKTNPTVKMVLVSNE